MSKVVFLCLVAQLVFRGCPSLANPTGGTVAAGNATIISTGNTMTITTSDRAVIHWQGFSIGANETTQFVQPSSSSAVLNRVTSGDASHILGTLQANGQVYLLNPNGVFIGNGAVINVGSFLATTANIADTDFMKGGNLTFSGTTEASIVNQGAITAMTGDVMLLARTVKNTESGTISAPQGTVAMAAGTQFYLKKDEIGAMRVEVKPEAVPGFKGETGVDNAGLLRAMRVQMEADGNLYGLAINQQGLVRATGVSHASDGTIVLSAPGGKIRQSGTMLAVNADGSGGQLSISGKDVSLTASSLA
ncbi:filamentous hemagglutinin N-terminal domain-containing protein, partial [bacterium]|nr:filamentous hemagglutinin N-terminal domain-containing protein [bacterium]